VEIQRPRATAPPMYQLQLPLELPEAVKPRARLLAPTVSAPTVSAPTVLSHQVWGALSLTERLRAQRVFVRVIQEVVGNGDHD
jgi:hypothetical protein